MKTYQVDGLVVNDLPTNAGGARAMGSIPESGKSPGGRNGNSFQYFCLENPMDRGVWWTTILESQRATEKTHTCSHTQNRMRGSVRFGFLMVSSFIKQKILGLNTSGWWLASCKTVGLCSDQKQ